jgi:hypothetical protein
MPALIAQALPWHSGRRAGKKAYWSRVWDSSGNIASLSNESPQSASCGDRLAELRDRRLVPGVLEISAVAPGAGVCESADSRR